MGPKHSKPSNSNIDISVDLSDLEDTLLREPSLSLHHQTLIRQSVKSLLAFSSKKGETALNKLYRKVITGAVHQVFEPREDILMKGEVGSGIYFILEGYVAVVTESGEDVIATLGQGQFFGEVSLLFKIPVTARVQAVARCECLLLEEETARSMLLSVTNVDIIDWFVTHMYIPTSEHLDVDRIYRRSTLVTLQRIPMFQNWTDKSVKKLILMLSDHPVTLYPANSLIQSVGEHCTAIYIVTRGSVTVEGKSWNCIAETDTHFPVFGETGFHLNKPSVLSVRTKTECQVIILRQEHIQTCAQQNRDGCAKAVETRNHKLSEFAQLYSSALRLPEDSWQYEVLFQHLSRSSLFSSCSQSLLDHLVLHSHVIPVDDGKLAYTADDSKKRTVMLVVEGTLQLVEEEDDSSSSQQTLLISKGQIVAEPREKGSKDLYRSQGESFVIKYTTSLLREAMSRFPNQTPRR